MMQLLENLKAVAGAVSVALLVVGAAPQADAAVLCGRRSGATGEIAEGSSIKFRTVCKDNELPVSPGDLGVQSVSGFVVRHGSTVSTNFSLSTLASCEPGEVATGGGGLAAGNDGGLPVMRSSRPIPDDVGATPTGWRVTEVNSAGTGTITLTAYVVCAVP